MIVALAQMRAPNAARWLREAYFGVGCVAGMAALWFLMLGGQLNLICALMISSVLVLALSRSAVTAAILTLAYLHVLGDLRRLADLATGVPDLDLLLLVGPAMALLLALPGLLRLRVHDPLSKAMLLLTVFMTLEVLNPAQGGIAVGISGGLFYLVPVLWFWTGRRLASPDVVELLLYRLLLPLGICAAVLGLWQTLVGFFPYEQAWIDATLKNYTALSLGGTTRAFGFSVSAAEYATLLELAAAATVAAFLSRRRAWLLTLPLLLTAMLLASGRTVVVKLILAIAVVWIARKRKPLNPFSLIKLCALILVGLAGISLLATMSASSGGTPTKGSATQESIAHLSGGLAHPFDEKYSTAGIHQAMFLKAISSGLSSPLGHGLGSTTGASNKFNGSNDVYSSEIDISDMFILMGPVGGITYLFVVFAAMRSALTYIQRTKLSVGLPVIGILTATLGAWLISGQYSTAALIFFLIGATTYKPEGDIHGVPEEQANELVQSRDPLSVAA